MDIGPWQVLHVVTNHERKVAQHLLVRSVEYYLPLYKERVKWTDRSVLAERPLFAGYVFFRTPDDRSRIFGIPGVLRILGREISETVSGVELRRIREGLESGLMLRPHPAIPVGALVRVRSGAFEGVVGAVSELRQQCRVVISMLGVRQCFSLEVERDNLEVLSPHSAREIQQPAMLYGS